MKNVNLVTVKSIKLKREVHVSTVQHIKLLLLMLNAVTHSAIVMKLSQLTVCVKYAHNMKQLMN